VCVLQAKTTKKIVLRLQCSECKQSSMKPIKVIGWLLLEACVGI
jgi:ribosomal protein L44E